MAAKKYDDCFISPVIRQVGKLETLQFNAKDMRGYDFSINLSAIEPDSADREVPETTPTDRIATFFGGQPDTFGDIGTEIKVEMGEQKEAHLIDAPAMVYIPAGQPYRETLTRQPDKRSWELHITLPPEYVEPE